MKKLPPMHAGCETCNDLNLLLKRSIEATAKAALLQHEYRSANRPSKKQDLVREAIREELKQTIAARRFLEDAICNHHSQGHALTNRLSA